MTNEELLSALNGKFDEINTRLDRIEARQDKMDTRLDNMDARLTSLEDHVPTREEVAHIMNVMIENTVTPKFNLLADELALIREKLTPAEETARTNDRLDVLEGVVKQHSREIASLKRAN